MRAYAVAVLLVLAGCGGGDDEEEATGRVSWVLLDGCQDGIGMQARFFDITHGGQWPANPSQVWMTGADGGSVSETLACIPGAKVCYGAEPNPTNGVYWGRSLSGAQACDDCCVICGGGDPPPVSLRCD